MDIKSKDLKADEAIKLMDAVTLAELDAFIEDDDRKTVINAAEERRKALTPTLKQGEVKGPITKDVDEFKIGIQRTKSADDVGAPLAAPEKKHITCEDVIKKMREQGKKI